jgi:hypothetical protein
MARKYTELFGAEGYLSRYLELENVYVPGSTSIIKVIYEKVAQKCMITNT